MDYLKAFLIGGLICALVQILLDRTKLMPGRIMVLLVCGGAFWEPCSCTSRSRTSPEPGQAFRLPGLGIFYGKASKKR